MNQFQYDNMTPVDAWIGPLDENEWENESDQDEFEDIVNEN